MFMGFNHIIKVLLIASGIYFLFFTWEKCSPGRITRAFAEADGGIRNAMSAQKNAIDLWYWVFDLDVQSYANDYNMQYLSGFQNLQKQHQIFNSFMDSLRTRLIESAGLSADRPLNAQPLKQDHYLVRRLLLEGKPNILSQIAARTEKLQTALLAFTNQEKHIAGFISRVEARKDGRLVIDGNTINFHDLPLSGALAILSLLQLNEQKHLMAGLSYGLNRTGHTSCPFDRFTPSVSTSSSFVPAGVPYSADVFLSGFGTGVRNVKCFINGQPMQVHDGVARFEEFAKTPGEHRFYVEIGGNIMRKKDFTYYPDTASGSKEFRYFVVSPHPQISRPSKTNILYAYVENPVTVEAWDGYNARRVSIRKGNATLARSENFKYIITPHTLEPVTLKVGSDATFSFVVRPLPDPAIRLGTFVSGQTISSNELENQTTLHVAFPEAFGFSVDCQILGFKVTRFRPREDPEEADNQGSTFNNAVLKILEHARSGDRLLFDEIQVQCGDEPAPRTLAGLSLRVQ